MKKTCDTRKMQIRPELAARFEKLTPAKTSRIDWTPEQDAIILKYWKQTNREEFCDLFSDIFGGTKPAINSFKRRYYELIKKTRL